ncbi:MAG: hypothetical protein NTX25_03545 [Proteobacteria bacterium]|nr:hypothetical protein [Pseudomonadota bacterium]
MRSKCFFCGNEFEHSESADGEHFLPKWLMGTTAGDRKAGKNRKSVIWNANGLGEHALRFYPQLKIPAHPTCNNDWNVLEKRVRKIFERLFNCEGDLNNDDIVDLMDWFDKVRWGYYAYSYKHSDRDDPRPKMKTNANGRVGLHDRILMIAKVSDEFKGLNIYGPGLPIFGFMPSAFAMLANQYLFFSLSDVGILSLMFGLPSISKILETNGISEILEFSNGDAKKRMPNVPFFPKITDGYLIGQAKSLVPREILTNQMVANGATCMMNGAKLNPYSSIYDPNAVLAFDGKKQKIMSSQDPYKLNIAKIPPSKLLSNATPFQAAYTINYLVGHLQNALFNRRVFPENKLILDILRDHHVQVVNDTLMALEIQDRKVNQRADRFPWYKL